MLETKEDIMKSHDDEVVRMNEELEQEICGRFLFSKTT